MKESKKLLILMGCLLGVSVTIVLSSLYITPHPLLAIVSVICCLFGVISGFFAIFSACDEDIVEIRKNTG